MEFWLNSMNMPSRDDVGRLTERVITLEDRLQMIDTGATPAEQIAPQLDLLTNKMEQRHGAMQTRIEEIQARIEALDGRIGQALQMIEGQASFTEGLGQQLSQLTEKVGALPAEPSGLAEVQQRLQALESRLDQIGEKVGALPAEPSGLAEVQQRLQALESRLDQVIQLVQERASQPAASAQAAEPAALETRVNALDAKAEHMLGLIQALHGGS
jgi:chromosome segregation ATPase